MNIVRIALVAISTVFSFITADVVAAPSLGIDVWCSINPNPDISKDCVRQQTNIAIQGTPYTTQTSAIEDQYSNTYTATAQARADYGALGASAVGDLSTGFQSGNTSFLTTSAMSSSTEKLNISGTGTVDIHT